MSRMTCLCRQSSLTRSKTNYLSFQHQHFAASGCGGCCPCEIYSSSPPLLTTSPCGPLDSPVIGKGPNGSLQATKSLGLVLPPRLLRRLRRPSKLLRCCTQSAKLLIRCLVLLPSCKRIPPGPSTRLPSCKGTSPGRPPMSRQVTSIQLSSGSLGPQEMTTGLFA